MPCSELVRSSVRGLVAKILQHSSRSMEQQAPSSPDLDRPGLRRLPGSKHGSWRGEVVVGGRAYGGTGELSDGVPDSDDSESETTGTELARLGGSARAKGLGGAGESYGGQSGGDGSWAPGVDVEQPACDLFLEAVSTGGMHEELLSTLAVEVRYFPSQA